MTLFLEKRPDPRLDREETLLFEAHVLKRNLPYERVPIKHVRRKQVTLGRDSVVAGSIQFVHAAIKTLGLPAPGLNYYPDHLKPWLYRNVWKARLRDVIARLESRDEPVFVKPAEKLKAFTGTVFHDSAVLSQVQYPKGGYVWCSNPVPFRAEWRVYVAGGEVRHAGFYAGIDETTPPDMVEINKALAVHMAATGERNFCADFGLLADGNTALVEMADGYIMGAYDISSEDYYAVIKGWWQAYVNRDHATKPNSLVDAV